MKLLLALFLFCSLASAQQPQTYHFAYRAPQSHWYTDKYFWAGQSVIGAAVAADYTSTALYKGGAEQNWLLGPHPSSKRLALVGTSAFATYSSLYVWDWKLSHNDPSKFWHNLGRWGIPAVAAVIHGYGAAHNFRTSR